MSILTAKNILNHPANASVYGEKPFKNRGVNKLIATGFALAISFLSTYPIESASAHEVHLPTTSNKLNASPVDDLKKSPVPVYFDNLGSFVSEANESKHDFLIRVSYFMREYTDKMGWETCGVIQESVDKSNKKWAIQLVTNASHIACLSIDVHSPLYVSTEERIHSHPKVGGFYSSMQDERMVGRACGSRTLTDPFNFSPGDLRAESGYLVTPSRFMSIPAQLLYQKNGEIQIISKLNKNPGSTPNKEMIGQWKSEASINLNALSMAPTNMSSNVKNAKKCTPF